MRTTVYIFLFLVGGILMPVSGLMGQETTVELTCKLKGCPNNDSLNLYRFHGLGLIKAGAVAGEKEAYTFTIQADKPTFYYLGVDRRKVLPVIVGPEEEVYVESQCSNIRASSFAEGTINRQYNEMMDRVRGHQKKSNKLLRAYQTYQYNNKDVSGFIAQMDTLDAGIKAYLDQLGKESPYLQNVAALFVGENYPNNTDKYPDELTYLKESFVPFADLGNPVYEDMPHVYEAFKSFANMLSRTRISEELQRGILDNALSRIPADSPSRINALGGIINGLKTKASTNYVHYGKQFVAAHDDNKPYYLPPLENNIEKMAGLLPGQPAPDFALTNPDGDTVSLADFKGKVVLLDFWASWCGPCRRENPNVVRTYNQYKDRGFDILGISLDHKRDAWIKAIENDGLEWHHASDLKGWKNQVAQQYAVSSIPHTVLIDEEGRILASRLRGHQLDRALETYFEQEE